jgi:hypothetical protein
MADKKLTDAGIGAITTPTDDDLMYIVDEPGTVPASKKITWANIKATLKTYLDTLYVPLPAPSGGSNSICDGRLTLESGVPVSKTDQVDKTVIYFTPYKGNKIALYDGASAWTILTFAELSLNVSAYTASKPYDIWAYNNGGAVALASTVWTNATTRATALATVDGVLCKTGATQYRYIGTIYMDAGSKLQITFGLTPAAGGSAPMLYVYNEYNKVIATFESMDSTNSWAYTTTSYQAKNNNVNNAFKFINGNILNISVNGTGAGTNTGANASCYVGLGIDSATVNSAILNPTNQPTANYPAVTSFALGYNAAVGYHYIQEIELGQANQTFLGDNSSPPNSQTGAVYHTEM